MPVVQDTRVLSTDIHLGQYTTSDPSTRKTKRNEVARCLSKDAVWVTLVIDPLDQASGLPFQAMEHYGADSSQADVPFNI